MTKQVSLVVTASCRQRLSRLAVASMREVELFHAKLVGTDPVPTLSGLANIRHETQSSQLTNTHGVEKQPELAGQLEKRPRLDLASIGEKLSPLPLSMRPFLRTRKHPQSG